MCSYCGCDAITVIGRFMAEHVEIVNALTELRHACEHAEAARVAAACDVMAGLLSPHTHAEEIGLFSTMREQEEFTDHIDRLCGEHASLDELLARVRAGEYDLFHTFEDALRNHIDREDNGLFPAAAIAMSGADWEEIDANTPPASGPAHHHHP